MPTITPKNLPDSLIEDVILDMAGYNLNDYGMSEIDLDVRAGIFAKYPDTISVWYDPHDERTVRVTATQIRAAYATLLDLDQQHVHRTIHGYIIDSWRNRDRDTGEIDGGEIDADVADCILQLAAYGSIVYG